MSKRKIMALVVLAVLFITGTAVADTSSDLIGTWYLQSIQAEGKTFSAASLGINMTMTLNADGSAAFLESSGEGTEEDTGNWSANGGNVSITLSGDTMVYRYADGQLVFSAGSDTLTFTKSQSSIPVRAQEIAVTDGGRCFIGSWTLYAILVDDVLLDAESEGVGMTLTVSDNEISFTHTENTSTESSTESFTYQLSNGRLAAVEADYQIAMCDDGTIHLVMTHAENGQEQTITYCFRKAQ